MTKTPHRPPKQTFHVKAIRYKPWMNFILGFEVDADAYS
jgi:hypothetical protein